MKQRLEVGSFTRGWEEIRWHFGDVFLGWEVEYTGPGMVGRGRNLRQPRDLQLGSLVYHQWKWRIMEVK